MYQGHLVDENRESFSFWKNLALSSIFFTITPLVILISLFCLFSLSKYSSLSDLSVIKPGTATTGVKIFASLPSSVLTIDGQAIASDSRVEIVKQYLAKYNSPLVPYSSFLVYTADKYSLDFRLTTAIAQQESNLCKIIPKDSYNCWGWGIYGDQSLDFKSYEDGIETVSKGLSHEYINKGYLTPEQIMTKYTPSSPGTWAQGVSQFISEME